MKVVAVAITTDVDLHGDQISKEALLQAKEQIRGTSCPAVGVGHDPTVPPLGKVLSAEVREREDGIYELLITQEVFERSEAVILPDGTQGIKTESESDRRPFVLSEPVERTQVSVDPNSFGRRRDADRYIEAVRADAPSGSFEPKLHVRKAILPDPELVITLGELAAAAFVSKKLFDKISERIGDHIAEDAAKVYDLFRAAILKFPQYVNPRSRPLVYVIQLPGDPLIEFVARTADPNILLSALAMERREASIARALDLHQAFRTKKIQFLLSDTGEWQFNFLLTADGAVVGTEASFRRQSHRLKMLQQDSSSQTGQLSVDGSA